MLNNQTIIGCLISIFGLTATILTFPANAQTERSQYSFLEGIEAGKDSGWQFSSTSESLSVKDDIKNLEEYSVSESDVTDIELEAESNEGINRRWTKDYSVEAEVYDY